MSRRQRGNASPISLFSFQDIIMSTSGIMIMVALLLSLELIHRREVTANQPPPPTPAPPEADRDLLLREIADLRAQQRRLDVLARQAAALSPAQVREETARLDSELAALRRELTSLEEELRLLDQQAPRLEAARNALQDLQARLNAERQRQAELRRELEDISGNHRSILSMPRGDARRGWLVEVTKDKIRAAPLGIPAAPREFPSGEGGVLASSGEAEFLGWVAQRPTAENYYFLFVRPGAAQRFDDLQEKLDDRGIAYGFDVAPASQEVLHPERGAAE